MAKASTEKSKSKPAAPKSRWYLHVMAAATLIGLIVVSTRAARKYVDTKVDPQTAPPRVVFKYQPAWMSDVLANQITSTLQPKTARSTFDHDLLVETVEKLKTNPWIERVRE